MSHRNPPNRSTDRTAADAWTGAAVMGSLSLTLIAYAFTVGSIHGWAQASLQGLADAGQGSGAAAFVSRMLPWLLLLPALVLFGAILYALSGLIGLRRRKLRRGARRRKRKSTLDVFKTAAAAQGVPARVAYQGFQMLQQHLPRGRDLSLSDKLESDLGLAPTVVRSLRLALMTKLDRDSDPGMRLPPAETVLDVLLSALQAPRRVVAPAVPVTLPGDPRSRR